MTEGSNVGGGADGGEGQESSDYWAVYEIFASQSQRKYEIIIFFSAM
jgi:hypothetical protein